MFGKLMGNVLKKVVQEVQNKNRSNPNVKTADGSVFENILDRFKQKQNHADDPSSSYTPAKEEFCDDLCNELNQAQEANVADANVETADSSVFADMKAQIEAMKSQLDAQASAPTVNSMPLPELNVPTPTSAPNIAGVMATTNSNGGTLGFRTSPDMGAPMHNVRIPEYSQLRVIEYSQNSVVLDGTTSRFAKVDFNGQQGWVLESYLAID